MTDTVNIATVTTLTGWSERTLWRRVADGTLPRTSDAEKSGKAKVPLAAIMPHLSISLTPDDVAIVVEADRGNADAQSDLALIFLEQSQYKEAIYWLELAAKQSSATAMYWLGRCHTDGTGTPKEENIGLMWIAKAAAAGHVISQAQIRGMIQAVTTR